MTALAQIFVVLAGGIHVTFWLLESVLFGRPRVHRGIFGTRTEDVPAVRLWALNQGFYNLFLAAGAIAGVVCLHIGAETVGRGVALFACVAMFGAGLVLLASDRRRYLRGAMVQAVPPLIALIAAQF
jgi:putative membrane protein